MTITDKTLLQSPVVKDRVIMMAKQINPAV